MSEYEIFGEDEEFEPRETKPKKQKIYKEKKSCRLSPILRDLFSINNISILLSIISIFFTIIVGITTLLARTESAFITIIVFFTFAIITAFVGLIFEVFKMLKLNQFVFSVHFILVIFAMIISCLLIPLNINLYAMF